MDELVVFEEDCGEGALSPGHRHGGLRRLVEGIPDGGSIMCTEGNVTNEGKQCLVWEGDGGW